MTQPVGLVVASEPEPDPDPEPEPPPLPSSLQPVRVRVTAASTAAATAASRAFGRDIDAYLPEVVLIFGGNVGMGAGRACRVAAHQPAQASTASATSHSTCRSQNWPP
jgi:hypothetical protein